MTIEMGMVGTAIPISIVYRLNGTNIMIYPMRNYSIYIVSICCLHLLACNIKSPGPSNLTPQSFGQSVMQLDSQIWKIFHDSNGNYWFGSNGLGAYKYDGINLTQYSVEDGLLNNQIRGFQEDKKGNIYIETPSGISKYNGIEFTTLQVLTSSDNQWRLHQDDLWFNCNSNHLYRYDGEWLHKLYLPSQDLISRGMSSQGLSFPGMNSSPYAVYGIDKDRYGNIWFGTITAGAYRYDGESFLWVGEPELTTLPDGRVPGVRSILQDSEGYMWLSNFYSKYKISNDYKIGYVKIDTPENYRELPSDDILYYNSGLVDTVGNLKMTTYDGRVWTYNGDRLSHKLITNGDKSLLLVSIYQDNNGTLWLGTNNDGAYRWDGSEFVKFEL